MIFNADPTVFQQYEYNCRGKLATSTAHACVEGMHVTCHRLYHLYLLFL